MNPLLSFTAVLTIVFANLVVAAPKQAFKGSETAPQPRLVQPVSVAVNGKNLKVDIIDRNKNKKPENITVYDGTETRSYADFDENGVVDEILISNKSKRSLFALPSGGVYHYVKVETRAGKILQTKIYAFNGEQYVQVQASNRSYQILNRALDSAGCHQKVEGLVSQEQFSRDMLAILQKVKTAQDPTDIANYGMLENLIDNNSCKGLLKQKILEAMLMVYGTYTDKSQGKFCAVWKTII